MVSFLCALLMVLCATVFNLNHNLSKRADHLEDLWEADYGIEEKIEERCSEAAQLWSLLHEYDALRTPCDRLRTSYNALYNMEMDMEYASSLYTANEELSLAADALISALREEKLSEEDMQWAERYYSNMVNAQRVLLASEYIPAQREFAQLLNAPHVALLRPLLFVDLPQNFGEN